MDQIRNVKKMVGKDAERMRKTAREKVWGYIAAALGLVAGLAWNDAIRGLIEHFFPASSNSVWAKLWYAVVITVVVVFVMMKFEKYFKEDEEKGGKGEQAQPISAKGK